MRMGSGGRDHGPWQSDSIGLLKYSWSTISSCSFPVENGHVGNVPHVFQQAAIRVAADRAPLGSMSDMPPKDENR